MATPAKINFIRTGWSDFLSLIWPSLCAACGLSMMRDEETLCASCRMNLPLTSDWLDPDNPTARKFWGRVPLEGVAALYLFRKGSPVQELIHNLKYAKRDDAGRLAGRLLAARLKKKDSFRDITAIVPVPLHPDKQKRRGYNQAEVIAQGMAEIFEVPCFPHALRRTVDSASQTRKGRIDRWESVEKLFVLAEPNVVAGQHVLLVDDVITTGATLESCAEALREGEHTRVSVAALAVARD